MKPLPPSPGALSTWSRQACAAVDTQLAAAEEAHRALNRAPYALLEASGSLPPPLGDLVRVQDAMTRIVYQSLIGWTRLAAAVSDQVIDTTPARAAKQD